MMFDVLLGPSPRKKMDKVALPTRRVFPRTGNVIGRLGGIENILNPPPQPSCRFGGGSPDRHQNCDHVIDHDLADRFFKKRVRVRSEEHTSELKSLMRNSYAVFCLKKNTQV